MFVLCDEKIPIIRNKGDSDDGDDEGGKEEEGEEEEEENVLDERKCKFYINLLTYCFVTSYSISHFIIILFFYYTVYILVDWV